MLVLVIVVPTAYFVVSSFPVTTTTTTEETTTSTTSSNSTTTTTTTTTTTAPEPDTDHPIMELVTPRDGDTVSGVVNITFTATDESNITSYTIEIDLYVRANTNSFLWNTSLENNGRHRITCTATDAAGNTGYLTFKLTVSNDHPVPDNITEPIKIITYNIWESGRNAYWKQVVKDENPDIMVLVETGNFDDKDNALLNRIVYEFNTYFKDELPYQGKTAQKVYYATTGEAILSRYPIASFKQIPKVTLDSGEDYWVTHDFIDALVRINGTDVHIMGAHLKAMSGETNEWRRERETEGIINYMDKLGNVPIIFAGDLNSFSPDDVGDLAPEGDLGYGPLTMLLRPDDPTHGNYSSKVHNFTDVFRTLNPDDPGYTYPGLGRIDYIIVNQYFTGMLINSTCGDTPDAERGSDHLDVDAFIRVLQEPLNSTAALFRHSRPGLSLRQKGDAKRGHLPEKKDAMRNGTPAQPDKGPLPARGLVPLEKRSVDLSRTMEQPLGELSTLAQDLQLVTTAIPAAVAAQKARLDDAPGLTLRSPACNHADVRRDRHDQLLLGIVDYKKDSVIALPLGRFLEL
ncbi:MAG: endonuclease/exonuclease/phosphatase family protein [Candidatus Thorarchaeota archaeon]